MTKSFNLLNYYSSLVLFYQRLELTFFKTSLGNLVIKWENIILIGCTPLMLRQFSIKLCFTMMINKSQS